MANDELFMNQLNLFLEKNAGEKMTDEHCKEPFDWYNETNEDEIAAVQQAENEDKENEQEKKEKKREHREHLKELKKKRIE